jgi:drug/metabolite transporter (DMT)-like permease
MKDQRKAILFASAAVLFWSTAATAFKLSLALVTPLALVVFSSLFSFLVILGLFVSTGKSAGLISASWKDYLKSAGLGFLNPYLYYLALFKAYSLLLGQEAMVLNYTWPIVLVILSAPLLRQRLGLRSIFALLVSFSGVVVIATRGRLGTFRASHPLGIILALCSSVIWALYWIFNVRDRREETLKLCLNFLFGFFYAFITLIVTEGLGLPGITGILGTLYVGLFEMGITFFVWLKALRYASSTAMVSNLIYISPFLSLIFIRLVLKEHLVLSTFFGLILIVFGVLIQSYPKRSRP